MRHLRLLDMFAGMQHQRLLDMDVSLNVEVEWLQSHYALVLKCPSSVLYISNLQA